MGISALVLDEIESQLVAIWELKLSILLPGERAPFEMMGVIRYRRLLGSALQYGIEFDPQRTPSFQRRQQLIASYIMKSQRGTI